MRHIMRTTVGFCTLSIIFSFLSCDAASRQEGDYVLESHAAGSPMTPEIHDITPAQVDSLISVDSTYVLLDVRTAPEFVSSTGHLKGAVLIPVQELEGRMNELEPYRGRKIVVYCRVGARSRHATQILRDWGFAAFNMTGGMLQWNAEKRPAVRENTE